MFNNNKKIKKKTKKKRHKKQWAEIGVEAIQQQRVVELLH